MIFYLVGPFTVAGMSWHEPYIALGIAGLWGLYGAFYFWSKSAKMGKPVFVEQKVAAVL
jgi:hypothetical protein